MTPQPRARGRETAGDMVRSLAVVLVVVGVVFFLTLRDEPKQQLREVGFSEALAETRQAATYDVLAPVGLGSGWTATSVRGSNGAGGAVTWHLGYVTPGGRYAGVEQSDGPRRGFVDEHAADARAVGAVRIGATTWRRLEGGSPDERALELREGKATSLVTGSASWRELRTLAAALVGG